VRVVFVPVTDGLPSVSSRNSGHFEFRPYDSVTELNSGATRDARRASVAARDLVAIRLRIMLGPRARRCREARTATSRERPGAAVGGHLDEPVHFVVEFPKSKDDPAPVRRVRGPRRRPGPTAVLGQHPQTRRSTLDGPKLPRVGTVLGRGRRAEPLRAGRLVLDLPGPGQGIIVSSTVRDKFAFICAQAGMTSAVGLAIGDIRSIPESMQAFRAIVAEVCEVSRAAGVKLSADTPDRHTAFAGNSSSAATGHSITI
jgi:hypothetical protein